VPALPAVSGHLLSLSNAIGKQCPPSETFLAQFPEAEKVVNRDNRDTLHLWQNVGQARILACLQSRTKRKQGFSFHPKQQVCHPQMVYDAVDDMIRCRYCMIQTRLFFGQTWAVSRPLELTLHISLHPSHSEILPHKHSLELISTLNSLNPVFLLKSKSSMNQ
jgi:hypothetical protein